MVPAEGGPKSLSANPFGAEGAEAEILAVSLKHWTRRKGGGPGGGGVTPPPPTAYGRSNSSMGGAHPKPPARAASSALAPNGHNASIGACPPPSGPDGGGADVCMGTGPLGLQRPGSNAHSCLPALLCALCGEARGEGSG